MFLQHGGQWPEGFNQQLLDQFINIHEVLKFDPVVLDSLRFNPEFIPVIYEAIHNPVGEEASRVKTVLPFAFEYGLNVQHFYFLLMNEAVFGQVKNFVDMNQPMNNYHSATMTLHLNILMTSQAYFQANNLEDYPQIGTDSWVNTLETNDDIWNRLTPEEKLLSKNNPYEALLIYQNKGIAEQKTIEFMGINGLNNKSDAFRHAYFQAINTMDIGATLTQQFSDAHETQVPTEFLLEKEMDLFNNSVGIVYGYTYTTSDAQMATYIYEWALLTGQLRYMWPINLNDPCFFPSAIPSCSSFPNGNHGIIPGVTTLTPTNQ